MKVNLQANLTVWSTSNEKLWISNVTKKQTQTNLVSQTLKWISTTLKNRKKLVKIKKKFNVIKCYWQATRNKI